MATYGYVRVSTSDQNLGRQVESMRSLGIPEANVVTDKASGKDLDREGWRRLMGMVTRGDTVVLDSLDRLGRNYGDVTREWRRLTRDEGVDLKVLDLDFFDSASFRQMGEVGTCVEDMLLSLLAYVAHTERQKMLRRQAEGIALAKKRGAYKGRKPISLRDWQRDSANAMIARGEAIIDVARYLKVSKHTVYAMIADGRLTR